MLEVQHIVQISSKVGDLSTELNGIDNDRSGSRLLRQNSPVVSAQRSATAE